MANAVKDEKKAPKPPAEKKPKKEKKAPELAVFRPRHAYSDGPKMIHPTTYVERDVNYQRLTDAQVKAEIDKGKHGRDEPRPKSPVLNHCDLVSASEATTKAVAKFMG